MRRPASTAILVTALTIITMAVFFLASRTRSPEPAFETMEQIRIANVGIYSHYNVLAEELGYFKTHGLDATIHEYDSGGTSLAALLNDEADVAIAADFVGARAIFTNEDIRIIATVSSHDTWRIVANDDHILKPSDLKGRRVGVTRGTAGEYFLGKFLTAQGMGIDDVVVVDLSATDIADALKAGTVDAAMMFNPNAARFRQSHSGYHGWNAQGFRRTLATVYTTRSFLQDRTDAVDRYLRALFDAKRYHASHPNEVVRVFADALGYDDATLSVMWPGFTFDIRLDQELLLTMEDQARWIIANGLVETDRVPNFLERISYDALEEIDPHAVTIIHE